MKVMVIGGGAREHALVARFVRDGAGDDILCTPGNPGIASLARIVPVPSSDPITLLDLAMREGIDFTVVGPEAPLSQGVTDVFVAAGQRVFGPTKAAAQLESSKAFAKDFMARHGVPTARFRVFDLAGEALAFVRRAEFGFPVVLKADGLAAGKGVVIATDLASAEAAVIGSMTEGRFGTAGSRLVIEECLQGPEVSFFVVSDGERALFLGAAQDHKRIFDDDRGPNTGGMGAFAPSPLVDERLHATVMRDIVDPVIAGMAGEGAPFRGFLYVGLMLTFDGPKVIEFNVRLGDPEAQVVLPLLAEPLLPVLVAAADGRLVRASLTSSTDKFVGVVLASRGYPESSSSGQVIHGIADAERSGATVYHAGTALRNGQLVTAGGRVLTVVGRGATFDRAIAAAYAGVSKISFDGMQLRRDIGRRAIG